MAAARYCGNCGSAAGDSVFCANCGARLSESAPAAPQRRVNIRLMAVVATAVLVVLIALAAAGGLGWVTGGSPYALLEVRNGTPVGLTSEALEKATRSGWTTYRTSDGLQFSAPADWKVGTYLDSCAGGKAAIAANVTNAAPREALRLQITFHVYQACTDYKELESAWGNRATVEAFMRKQVGKADLQVRDATIAGARGYALDFDERGGHVFVRMGKVEGGVIIAAAYAYTAEQFGGRDADVVRMIESVKLVRPR